MLRKTLCLGLVAIVATLGLSVESLGWGGAHYSYHYGGGYGGGGYHYSYHAGGYGGGGYHYGGGGSGGGAAIATAVAVAPVAAAITTAAITTAAMAGPRAAITMAMRAPGSLLGTDRRPAALVVGRPSFQTDNNPEFEQPVAVKP